MHIDIKVILGLVFVALVVIGMVFVVSQLDEEQDVRSDAHMEYSY